jgi:GNAT superfamily N-acetyltransferase
MSSLRLRSREFRKAIIRFYTTMNDITFITHLSQDKQGREKLQSGLAAIYTGLGNNIVERTGITELGKSIGVLLKNKAEETVGGVVGNAFGGWLYISVLWIEKSLRNKGYGTRLMNLIELEAVKIGCTDVHLDTYSFEARPFYEKLGYEVFAMLDDCPKGYSKYFLKKQLTP